MTRKQALEKTIEILINIEDFNDKEETITKLNEIIHSLPMTGWDDKTIRDSVDQYILDNQRIPTASDFKKKGLPPHPVIQNRYGITLSEWLDINYPRPRYNNEEKMKEGTAEFIIAYNDIKPASAKDFDRRRPKGVKSWVTIAQYNKCSNWKSLLNKLSLKSYSSRRLTYDREKINVTVYHDLFDEF